MRRKCFKAPSNSPRGRKQLHKASLGKLFQKKKESHLSEGCAADSLSLEREKKEEAFAH